MTNPDYIEFLRLFPAIEEYQKLADKYKIADIFQDNGGKYLQLLILLGLRSTGDREGNDAFDEDGNEYEIKTVNAELVRGFSTHHHMNPVIIAKYRKVDWFFAVYKSIRLQVIFRMKPEAMEPFYTKWETKWNDDGGKDINNPKIPLKYVQEHGEIVWLPEGVKTFELEKKERKPKAPKKVLTLDDL